MGRQPGLRTGPTLEDDEQIAWALALSSGPIHGRAFFYADSGSLPSSIHPHRLTCGAGIFCVFPSTSVWLSGGLTYQRSFVRLITLFNSCRGIPSCHQAIDLLRGSADFDSSRSAVGLLWTPGRPLRTRAAVCDSADHASSCHSSYIHRVLQKPCRTCAPLNTN